MDSASNEGSSSQGSLYSPSTADMDKDSLEYRKDQMLRVDELLRRATAISPSPALEFDEKTDLIEKDDNWGADSTPDHLQDDGVFRVVVDLAHDPKPKSRSQSASSAALQIHGTTNSSSEDTLNTVLGGEGIPSVEDIAQPSHLGEVRRAAMSDNGEVEAHGLLENGQGKQGLLDTQGDVMAMSTLITTPDMRSSENIDLSNASIHQLARDGDVEMMRRLLNSLHGKVRKKVNAHDDSDLSALHYAARYNHVPIVSLLIDFQANPNDTDNEGGTPLHFAARYKAMRLGVMEDAGSEGTISCSIHDASKVVLELQIDEDGTSQGFELTPENSVILHLLSRKANVNAPDIYGCTPLHFAAMRGNEVATKELLTSTKCNIEARDKQNMTALHLAASHEEAEVVRMLLEKGANLMCEDMEHGIPLHFACMEGSVEVVNMLFDAAMQINGTWIPVTEMVQTKDSQENTPLHLAVESQSLGVAQLCLEKGALVNATRDNYMTPLHIAAVAGALDIVKLLIEHNARVDALDQMGQTPLHAAAEYDHNEIVEYLLEKGADINRHDKDNYSPLLLAAVEGNSKTLSTLLKCKAKIYEVDKADKTALFLCAEQDKLEALQVLLEHPKAKALLDVSDRYDNTPLHIAAQNGFVTIVKTLLDAGSDIGAKNEEEQTPVHLAAANGKTGVVRELVKRNKAVVNHEDEDSNTALHLASLAGHNKVVKELIEAGADIEARNTTLWTPLDCAAAKGWPKIVRLLLEADAPVDPMDKRRDTPLLLASGLGHTSVVILLMERGASVKQRDTNGCNCLDRAIDGGHKDVVMAIINSSHWKEALMNETIDLSTSLRQTPMRKLIKKMPDAAERVFSHCTTSEISNPDHPDYSITFNYEFLDDMYSCWREEGMSENQSESDEVYDDEHHLLPNVKPYTNDSTVLKKNHPLMIMVRANQEDLLAHPLVTSLLKHKWESFGRSVYYVNLIIFCIYLAFLTAYIIVAQPPYLFYYKIRNTSSLLSECERIRPFYTDIPPFQNWLFIFIGKYLVIIPAGINVLREIFQIYNTRLNYIGWENLIEWLIWITSILFVLDFDGCQQMTGIRTSWQWQLGSIAIFFSWMELVLFLRKLPRFGIYVVMFTDVLRSFVSFLPVFLLFIVAFALSFHAVFQMQDPFQDFWHSVMKTAVMMIGEFDYEDTFYPDDPIQVPYKEVSYIVFTIFIIIMSIIIMNLLVSYFPPFYRFYVGLAVDDIKAVQEQAVLKRLAMQVNLALDVEALLPQFLRRKFVRRCRVIHPNCRHGCRAWCLKRNKSALSSNAITKALNPELDEMEQLRENQEKMNENINNLRFRVKTLSQQNQTLCNMMTAVLKHHAIEFNDEDFQDEGESNR